MLEQSSNASEWVSEWVSGGGGGSALLRDETPDLWSQSEDERGRRSEVSETLHLAVSLAILITTNKYDKHLQRFLVRR